MSKVRIAIYGAGYLGQQVWHHLFHYYADTTELLGFIDDSMEPGLEIVGKKYTLGSVAKAQHDKHLGPEAIQLVFAIGYSDMRARRSALDRVLGAGYKLFSVIHPLAVLEPGAEVGDGCTILGGTVVDQGVAIGAGSFVDIGVRLGAGTVVGNNNYLSSGTSTGSRVKIGENCFFGMDCTITTDVVLGSNLFVNAKSLVARNMGDNLKFVELHKAKQLPIP